MVSFVLSVFPQDVLDEIWDLIESVSEGFPTYSQLNRVSYFRFFYVFLASKGSSFRTGVQLKREEKLSTLIGFHLTCRLSHYIYIISNTFVTYGNFSKLIRKLSPTNSFFARDDTFMS